MLKESARRLCANLLKFPIKIIIGDLDAIYSHESMFNFYGSVFLL